MEPNSAPMLYMAVEVMEPSMKDMKRPMPRLFAREVSAWSSSKFCHSHPKLRHANLHAGTAFTSAGPRTGSAIAEVCIDVVSREGVVEDLDLRDCVVPFGCVDEGFSVIKGIVACRTRIDESGDRSSNNEAIALIDTSV